MKKVTSQSSKDGAFMKGKKKPTKIKDLQPGDEDVNILAEIIEIGNSIQVSKGNLFCIIGDDTGVVWAELPQHHADVKENVVVFLESVQADVHEKRHKLIIRLTQESLVHRNNVRIQNINLDMDMSR